MVRHPSRRLAQPVKGCDVAPKSSSFGSATASKAAPYACLESDCDAYGSHRYTKASQWQGKTCAEIIAEIGLR